MAVKKILGLDLGTNSIGWALIEQDFENKSGKILGMGSRIIPMEREEIDNFVGGKQTKTKTSERTSYRITRRIRQRRLLRRDRLHRVLNVLGFLPEHYANEIDFTKRLGQFKDETEPKLAWRKNSNNANGINKFEFIFLNSYNEMLDDFRQNQPELLNRKNRKGESAKIPYDWTIYYLRKKALSHKISKEELAWIILNFNQKRGYYELRGENEEKTNTREYIKVLKVTKIEKGNVKKNDNNKTLYTLTLENGWTYSALFTAEPQWLNKEKEFLITEELDENGNVAIVKDKKNDTTGKEKRKIKHLPSLEEIYTLSKEEQDKNFKKIKAKTEFEIENSNNTVGTFIYETLLKNPNQKIRGKLIRTIERKFYKDELKQILQKQIELQPELFTEDKYVECVRELYRSNKIYQQQLENKKDFIYLFIEDIIFYQRPLRSQKSNITKCRFEFVLHKINKKDNNGNPIQNEFEKDENGTYIEIKKPLKASPKSNPYYQEFRIWKWMKDLRIYQKEDNKDVTNDFLQDTEDLEKLFEFLNNREEIQQESLIKFLIENRELRKTNNINLNKKTRTEINKKIKEEINKYHWNYDEDKKFPCNKTRSIIQSKLKKVSNLPDNFLTREIEQHLWHIIYSVTDKLQFKKALKKFAQKHNLDESTFVESFEKIPPFPSEYGSYSEKALKKLLSLMRVGKYWNREDIPTEVFNNENAIKERLKKISEKKEIENITDDDIPKQILKSFYGLSDLTQGLKEYQAIYLVYKYNNRHSESGDALKWYSVNDLETFLQKFKQHSLRNPVVEQIVTETLRVVRDIWVKYGKAQEKFFDEIHIELSRELKCSKEERERMTKQITENEKINQRIKLLLAELKKNDNNVKENSTSQFQILKIYENGVLSKYSDEELKKINLNEDNKEITIWDISRSNNPSEQEIRRYKLWLEQQYVSPYTGKIIPLSKLFTPAYQIDHIIPQSLYFDDSLNNKVICEAAVNQLKDKRLGMEFIKNYHGQKVDTGYGNETVEILSVEKYISLVKENYRKNPGKYNRLLMEEVPDKMIERQINDTRYISKYVSNILSNIVRSRDNDIGINSKNLIHVNGKITSILRREWGLEDVWNELILPRFERMNKLTGKNLFTTKNKEGHTIPIVPMEFSYNFDKKRIDHRHHALDALVIACTTREHVQYFNNEHAKSQNYNLQKGLTKKLRKPEKVHKPEYVRNENNVLQIKKNSEGQQITKEITTYREYLKPWQNFTSDAKDALENIVVSYKQNLRVINKASNYYEKIVNGKKIKVKQEGVNWAIRKPLHKETFYGKIELSNKKNSSEKNILTVTRKNLNPEINIEAITDEGIKKSLKK